MVTDLTGLAASKLIGIGEILLHCGGLARYTVTFAFFKSVARNRATIGHFFGVFGAPLYVAGAYHIYLMVRSTNETAARIAGLVMA